MTRTRYVGASVAMLATILAASLVAMVLAQAAFSQEREKKPHHDAAASDEGIGVQATSEQVIASDGPLASIAIGDDLSCQVDHNGNGEGGEFYEGDPSALETDCFTLLAVGDETFGKYYTEFTPVSQSEVTGNGTRFNPFKITTVVDAGETGLRITQTDSYVVGNDFYTTQDTVQNRGTSRQNAILYNAGDCYLNLTDDDTTGKVVQTLYGRAPACTSTDPNAPEELRLLPRSLGSTYTAGYYDDIYTTGPDDQEPYKNTCNDDADPPNPGQGCGPEIDSGVGISWNLSILRSQSVSRSHQTQVIIPQSSTP